MIAGAMRGASAAVRTAAVLVLGLVSVGASAAEVKRPDFSGFWMLAGKPVEDPVLKSKLSPGGVVLADTAVRSWPWRFRWSQAHAACGSRCKSWKQDDDMTISATCRIPSIVYAMQGPFPIEIFQGTELTVLRLEYFDMARVIFTDGRAHMAAGAPLTKTGNSVGHWEGDTLVVETRHLKEATITNNGLSHSDQIQVTERFRLSADGKQLLSTQEFADPVMLQNRGIRYITWNKVEGDHVHAYDCDPSFAENYAD